MRMNRLLICMGLLFCVHYFSEAQTPYKTSYVISQDGTGDFKTIQEALNSAKAFPDIPITIRIKPGTYREKIEVHSWTTHISLIGEDAATTIIAFDDYSGKGNIN